MMGLRPVVEIMTINFSLLAIDQIVSNAAKLRSLSGGQVSVPLVIRTPGGGGGQQLSATHSQNPEVFYAHVPGLKVVAPATCADAKGCCPRRSATTTRSSCWRTWPCTTPRGKCPTGST
jgi:pyruvate dehydrogenase E1 component beta subunit